MVKEGVKTLNENYWVPAFTLIMGLDNNETADDRLGDYSTYPSVRERTTDSKFTVTPLTFVPIGLLEKSDFFDIGNTMDPAKLGVMYKTWQHNFKYAIHKFMHKVGQNDPIKKFFFASLARTLAVCVGEICS